MNSLADYENGLALYLNDANARLDNYNAVLDQYAGVQDPAKKNALLGLSVTKWLLIGVLVLGGLWVAKKFFKK